MNEKKLGLSLEKLREDVGVSRYRLGKDSGVDYPALTNIESGKSAPNIRTLNRIAKGLGFDLVLSFRINGIELSSIELEE